jgi:hypothetical protein
MPRTLALSEKTCIPCSAARRDAVLRKRQQAVSKAAAAEEDGAKDALHTNWDDGQQSTEKKWQRLLDARQARQARALSRMHTTDYADTPGITARIHSPPQALSPDLQ